MKLLFALFIVLGAGAIAATDPRAFDEIRAGGHAAASELAARFRVIDWNIDRGTEMDAVRHEIERDRADLCILQEVDYHDKRSGFRDEAADLSRALGMNYAFAVAFQELNQSTTEMTAYQGQATLSKAALGPARMIRFVRQTGFWKPQPFLPSWFPQRRLGGRIALVTQVRAGGRDLLVYNLHLESRGPGKARSEQLKETLADADKQPKTMPVVIAGDLNTKYEAGSFETSLEAHGFASCFGKQHVRTHRIIGDLDWIFVRGPIQCSDAAVRKSAAGSDHFPITATLLIR